MKVYHKNLLCGKIYAMETIICASGNKDKIRELGAILAGFDMEIISKAEAGFSHVDPVEDGETYEENSRIKAEAIMALSGKPVIADDSGLEVDYLGGAPGIHSARYAGEEHSYEKNNSKMLMELSGVPIEERGAKFVSVITMLFPDGREIVARGECPGHIIEELRGENGFGFDPLFMPEGYDKTFAEMDSELKNSISHRGRALKDLAHKLRALKEEELD